MNELQIAFITNAEVRRWMRVLAIIERENHFTRVALSERLGISQRTMIKDLQSIKIYFGKAIQLTSFNAGFYFEVKNRMDFQEKKSQLVKDEVLINIVTDIFYGYEKSLSEAADQYNYGESTMRRFLAQIQPILATYGLTITSNPLELSGNEVCIRKFFFDFYYQGEHLIQDVHPPEELHSLILAHFSDRLGNYELGTGTTISGFYYQLYITMVRVQQYHFISLPDWLLSVDYQEKDFHLFFSMQDMIKKEFGISLPKEELSWVHLWIISQRTTTSVSKELLFSKRFNNWPKIQKVVSDYLNEPFFIQWDTKVLAQFLTSFFVSLLLNEAIHPVLNKELVEIQQMAKKAYEPLWEKNVRFMEKQLSSLGVSETYGEDIVARFTLFTRMLLEKYQPSKHVVFLLEGDYLAVQEIRYQAQAQLGAHHHLVFLRQHELTPERLEAEQVDLIVTNYRPYMMKYTLQTDIILMKIFPDKSDWNQVTQWLNPLKKLET